MRDRGREKRGGASAGQLEGRQPVLEALRAGRPVRKILVADTARHAAIVDRIVVLADRRGVPVERVPARVIEARAHTTVSQGVIALVPSFRYADLEVPLEAARTRGEAVLMVAVDGVTDPRNLGAIARSAEAAGAHGVVVPERRSADVGPVVEKAAAGALAWLPVVRVVNLASALERLRARGVWIVSLDATADTPLWDLRLHDEALCLVVGGEGRGVSRLVLDRSDAVVRIPLTGRVESLNVSVAAGVALFEVARLRSASRRIGGNASAEQPERP